ncbi:hypothetical protein BGX28_009834, partial [Mortierella sp. GBA30]
SWHLIKSKTPTRAIVLNQIEGADTLILHFDNLSNINPVMMLRPKDSRRVQMLNKLETLARKDQLRIRDLDFKLNMDSMTWSGLSLMLRIVGRSITRLHLDVASANHIFPLSTVLDSCPGLLILHVQAYADKDSLGIACLEEPHRINGASAFPPTEHEQEYGREARGNPDLKVPSTTRRLLRLQSCSFYHMCLTTTALEPFLLSCPALSELRLVSIRSSRDSRNGNLSLFNQQPRETFLRRLSEICPRLKSFHISLFVGPLQFSESLVAELPSLFESLNAIGVDQQSLYSRSVHLSLLNVHWNAGQITTLEIIKDKNPFVIRTENMMKIGELLHEFLCDASGMLHLKGHGGYITLSNLRVPGEGILIWNGEQGSWGRAKNKVWACRGLRTLEAEFIPDGASYLDDHGLSRLMFGYISHVCPRLQDLAVKFNGMKLDLEGGLCLLSRLKELRRLWLKPSWQIPLWKTDLDWIKRYYHYKTGNSLSETRLQGRWERLAAEYSDRGNDEMKGQLRNKLNKLRPRVVRAITHLQDRLFRAKEVYPVEEESVQLEQQEQDFSATAKAASIQEARGPSIVDGIDMTNIGHIDDIKSYFHERRSRRSECLWAEMEYLEIFHTCRPKYSKDDHRRLCEIMREYRLYASSF